MKNIYTTYHLYYLFDPRTNDICYVGITSQEFKERLRQHRNPKKDNKSLLAKLQRKLSKENKELVGNIVLSGSKEFIGHCEKQCIKRFKNKYGKKIKNLQSGGFKNFNFKIVNRKNNTVLFRQGEKSSSNKLTEKEILDIYKLIREFYSNKEIINKLKLPISTTALNQIRKGKNWKYLWEKENMIEIPSMSIYESGLNSRDKINMLKDIDKDVSEVKLKVKYNLSITDVKRIKNKTLWVKVWRIYNKFIK